MANGAQFDRDYKAATCALEPLYSQDEIDVWMTSRHKALGDQRPIDLLGTERAVDVCAVIDALASGAYV